MADAELLDFTTATLTIDDRRDYGETHYRAFGRIGGASDVLVFVQHGEETIRAISFRRAHEKEMKRHGA